jgi:hypothetical protein
MFIWIFILTFVSTNVGKEISVLSFSELSLHRLSHCILYDTIGCILRGKVKLSLCLTN